MMNFFVNFDPRNKIFDISQMPIEWEINKAIKYVSDIQRKLRNL